MTNSSIETRKNMPYEILGGEFGKEVLEKMQSRALSNYQGAIPLLMPALSEQGEIVCTTPYSNVLMNDVLRDYGKRMATMKDIATIAKHELIEDSLLSADIGLYLTGKQNPNPYLAKTLVSDVIRKKGEFESPTILNTSDLKLKIDEKAPHGLSFELRKNANPIYAPTLERTGIFYRDSMDKHTGVPSNAHNEVNDSVEGVIYHGRIEQEGLSRLATLPGLFPLGGFLSEMGSLCYLDSRMRNVITDIEGEKYFDAFKISTPRSSYKQTEGIISEMEKSKKTVLGMEHAFCDIVGTLNYQVPKIFKDMEEGNRSKYLGKIK